MLCLFLCCADTGVQITHPDLAGSIWSNPGETEGNGRDDDANDMVDDISELGLGGSFGLRQVVPALVVHHKLPVTCIILPAGWQTRFCAAATPGTNDLD